MVGGLGWAGLRVEGRSLEHLLTIHRHQFLFKSPKVKFVKRFGIRFALELAMRRTETEPKIGFKFNTT